MSAEWPGTTNYWSELATRPGGRFSWLAVAEIAGRQHNVISRSQLRRLGLATSGAHYHSRTGKLRRVHRGVYAVGAAPLTREGNWMAAVLACGVKAFLSHRSAGARWGIRPCSRTMIDVISPSRAGRQLDGIDAHTASTLLPRDVTIRDGIPCTSVARTLLDLAAVVEPDQLARAVEQAEIQRLFDLRAINDVLARNPGHRGAARLRAALNRLGMGRPKLRSEFERRFLPIAAGAALPTPLVNHWLQLPDGDWLEIDLFWPELRLAAEADGLSKHGTRSGQRRDRARDRRLAAIGIQTVRFTWEDLDEPAAVRSQLEAVAAQRAA